jgi:hypothetical protein
MDVDATLHTFSPERPVRRTTALLALLRSVEALAEPAAACLPAALGRSPSQESVCSAAARCRLVSDPGDCLSGATLSGAQALELLRRALQLFAAS